jgi:hypothetical protein
MTAATFAAFIAVTHTGCTIVTVFDVGAGLGWWPA